MDRDTALHTTRERFEPAMWALIDELERTLKGMASVPHVDMMDLRAVGSVLNCALPEAAAEFSRHGLEIAHFNDGKSNKIAGSIEVDGVERPVNIELHLSGPKGGTSKSMHQLAGCVIEPGCDIDREPSLPGLVIDAPPDLLFFLACHLSPTGVSVARSFFKFADGVDQRMIELHRPVSTNKAGNASDPSVHEPKGAKLRIKKPKGEKEENGSATNKRGDAASGEK